ncbi:MAG: cysteine--tRNA ligase, partial [Deltaproteobacteria bacterium]|nr:cysteine--tRNA ligase [Deltaproteobacteria bacterium]
TVYALSHIGHARSAVSFDGVYRYLLHKGYTVNFTKNYTDVDDKIINRSNEEGITSKEVAEKYIKAYDNDMAALNVSIPTNRPRATETIPEMISLIERLIEKSLAYAVDGDVFFSVRGFKGYGKLSGKNIEDLESGARVSVDERKVDPLDFALWKSAKPDEPSWDSPWGKGRPGWHIECSAMCLKLLGETIDIHGGGKDLIFPHHENEIAQSEGATGKPFAKYWMHNGFVNMSAEKMSKSIGNILNIEDTLKDYSPDSIRLFLLSSHYRSPIEYTPTSLKEAEAKAERYYRTITRIEERVEDVASKDVDAELKTERMKPVIEAMDDDFNTAGAIGLIFKEIAEANRLLDKEGGALNTDELALIYSVVTETARIIGTLCKSPLEYFEAIKGRAELKPEEIERLIEERNEARKNKDFPRSDEIRDELKAKNIILEDTSKGTTWTVKGA